MSEAPVPHITIGIPTCNRPQDLARCLNSLVTLDYQEWDIIVIDQGDDNRATQVIYDFANRLPSLSHYRTQQKGVSRARNLIMQKAQGDILAFLDDDCSVEPEWLQSIARAFELHRDVSLVVGDVKAASHDNAEYFIPAYHIERDRVLGGKLAFLQTGIMSAGIYVRRDLAKHGPLWDIYLGPGSKYPLSDDRDYAYRVLASGHKILETPTIAVTHHGAREYRNGAASRLIKRAPYSQGVMDIKLLWCGDLAAAVLMAVHMVRYLTMVRPQEIFIRRGPTRLAWPVMYVYGLVFGVWACLRVPLNRRQRLWGLPVEYSDPVSLDASNLSPR